MTPRLVLGALLAFAASGACSSDDGTSAPGGGGGAGVGGAAGSGGSGGGSGDAASDASTCTLSKAYSSQDADCNACAEKECCVPINDCYADADCDDGYVNCILACALLPGDAGDAGVESCLGECAAQHPKGKSEYDAAIGCADDKCASVCD